MDTPLKERFSSILIFDVDTIVIEALLNDATGMGESGLSYMVERIDSDYVVMTTDRLGKLTAQESNVNASEGIAPHMLRNELNRGAEYCITHEYHNESGVKVLAHNHMLKIGEHNMGIITEIDSDEVFRGASSLLVIISLISLGILLIAVLSAVLFSRSLSRPIKYVSGVMATLATGDLSVTVDEKAQKSSDQIGEITRKVNELVHILQNTVSVILSSSEQITSASMQLDTGNQDLSNRRSSRQQLWRRPLQRLKR